MKIAIFGNSGSGKSTRAVQLGQKLGLPVYHLDQYYWKPGWCEAEFEEFYAQQEALMAQPDWILDGMQWRFIPARVAKAEILIFLNVPRYRCVWRVFKRYLFDLCGRARLGAPEQCAVRLSFKHVRYTWAFEHKHKNKILELLAQERDQKHVFIVNTQEDWNLCVRELELKKNKN